MISSHNRGKYFVISNTDNHYYIVTNVGFGWFECGVRVRACVPGQGEVVGWPCSAWESRQDLLPAGTTSFPPTIGSVHLYLARADNKPKGGITVFS